MPRVRPERKVPIRLRLRRCFRRRFSPKNRLYNQFRKNRCP